MKPNTAANKEEASRREEPRLELKQLVRSPALKGRPRLQELVRFRLHVQLEGLRRDQETLIRVTADANYLLWVNGILAGQGPPRNFPDTLVGELYDIGPLLREGGNEIVALVRHLYVDTFGYLVGEPAFGLAGVCQGADLSTCNGQWQCRTERRWNEYAPRVNMHLGPLEEQCWNAAAGEEEEWIGAVACRSMDRRIIPSPMAPLRRTDVELSGDAVIMGTFPRLPLRNGKVYACSREPGNRVVAVALRMAEAAAEEQVYIGIRGQGGVLMERDGTSAVCHPYGHHVGEDYVCCSGSSLQQGVLLYLMGAEYVVLGSASPMEWPDELKVDGYIPSIDPLFSFDRIIGQLRYDSPLLPFKEKLTLRAVGETAFHTWKEMGEIRLLGESVPLVGEDCPDIETGNGMVIRLNRFRFGHFRLELEAETQPDRGLLEIGYGHTEDAQGRPMVFNYDRLVWSGGSAVFENRFTPRGAQYLLLSASVPVRIKKLVVVEALAPMPAHPGQFRTDSPGWNGIWQTAAETLRYSRTDVISSDSFREFCAWLGDTQHIALNYYYSHYDPAFIRYTWELFSRNTDGEGRMFSVAPGYMRFQLPVWTWQFWIGVRNHCLYTGDREFLQAVWPVCLQTHRFFGQFLTEEGLLKDPEGWAIVDWAKIDFGGESFVLNGLYRLGLLALADLAEYAGDGQSKGAFEEAAGRIVRALAAPRFYCSERRLFMDGVKEDGPAATLSQHAQILAVSMGLWREEQGELWQRISDPGLEICTLGEPSFHWAASLLWGTSAFVPFVRYMWEVYEWKMSLGVACFGHIHPRNRPGDYRHKQGSPAHGWSSSPVYVSGAFLLGIRPLAPGYKEAIIEPCLALEDVTEAEGQVMTPCGPIRLAWKAAVNGGDGWVRGQMPREISALLDIRQLAAPGGRLEIIHLEGLQATERPGGFRVTAPSFELRFRQ
ncbi:alpha-L-rhamnosidase C-terminal domain-containing protein [Paenibacillus sp. YN15]|uniref:alpha-L-rhamnosidase-related protein n=1 Tax=Paenibacillus sp. YN15 TaxID=1742774 RepID=UPI0015EBB305|nr:alpha-L-rhamnosidase C-terminal domain-containing protein [Paenibacillus sp. YN15]